MRGCLWAYVFVLCLAKKKSHTCYRWQFIRQYFDAHKYRRNRNIFIFPLGNISNNPVHTSLGCLTPCPISEPGLFQHDHNDRAHDLPFLKILCKEAALLQKRWFVPVGKPLLSRFPNRELQSGIKGGALLSRVWQPGQKVHFFLFLFSQLFFYFDYTFIFQLNLCIEIQCVRSPLIYTYI